MFNLDGPDNWKTWMEQKTEIHLNKRQCGGGSNIVWGMLLPTGEIFVKKVTGKIKSDEYIKTLRESAIRTIRDLYRDDFVLQRDNCSLHVHVWSKTLEFLEGAGIEVLPWPSRSPDLNLIENLRVLTSSRVYDGPRPTNLDDLCQKFDEAVSFYNLHCKYYSEALYTSQNKRFLFVVTKTEQKLIISFF